MSPSGGDDLVPLQTALTDAVSGPGCLVLEPGVYPVTRRQSTTASAIPSLVVSSGPLHIIGHGATLSMSGTGILPGETKARDWVLLQVSGSDIHVDGLSFDGSARLSTSEQTHLLQVRGPSQDVLIEGGHYNLPSLGPSSGGDCVRLFGGVVAWVDRTTIRDITGSCDRSLVGLQRGVSNLLMERLVGEAGDNVVDHEPTGGDAFCDAPTPPRTCQPIVHHVVLRDSELGRPTTATNGSALSIAGDNDALADQIEVNNVRLIGGGIDILDVGEVLIHRVTAASLPGTSNPVLLARKRVGSLRVTDSELDHLGGAGPGVQVSAQAGVYPTHVSVLDSTVRHNASAAVIRTEGLQSLVLDHSTLVYSGAPGAAWGVVAADAAGHPSGSTVLLDSRVIGPVLGIATQSGPHEYELSNIRTVQVAE